MKLQEAKDQIAKEYGAENWEAFYDENYRKKIMFEAYEKVAELYKENAVTKITQQIAKAAEIKAQNKKKKSALLTVRNLKSNKEIEVFKIISMKDGVHVWGKGEKKDMILGKTCELVL